jgi:hypothetical protein
MQRFGCFLDFQSESVWLESRIIPFRAGGPAREERSAREKRAISFHHVRQSFWSQIVLNLKSIFLIPVWLRSRLPNQATRRMGWLHSSLQPNATPYAVSKRFPSPILRNVGNKGATHHCCAPKKHISPAACGFTDQKNLRATGVAFLLTQRRRHHGIHALERLTQPSLKNPGGATRRSVGPVRATAKRACSIPSSLANLSDAMDSSPAFAAIPKNPGHSPPVALGIARAGESSAPYDCLHRRWRKGEPNRPEHSTGSRQQEVQPTATATCTAHTSDAGHGQ